jgi:hypothetical protein
MKPNLMDSCVLFNYSEVLFTPLLVRLTSLLVMFHLLIMPLLALPLVRISCQLLDSYL